MTTDSAVAAALTACVAKESAAGPVVAAASKGAMDWQMHVQGQTDLETGQRSLTDVKGDMWGPTRAAGPTDVTAFQSAKARYDRLPACTAATGSPAASNAAVHLAQCLVRQHALDGYLSAATAVMTDWSGHLAAMARHSDGTVSSAAAQEDWLARWKAAPQHLEPFVAAAATLTASPACAAGHRGASGASGSARALAEAPASFPTRLEAQAAAVVAVIPVLLT